MTTRSVVVRKSLSDFANPILLGIFFVLYVGVAYFIGLGLSQDVPDEFTVEPLHVQEQLLSSAFAELAFIWGVGIPVMVLAAVVAATGIAGEFESGTLRILLSKPIHRWEVLLGKFLAVVAFTFLAMLAGSLVTGAILYHLFGASPAVIAGSVGALLPATLAYSLFVAVVIGSIATVFAVVTGSKIQTILGSLVIPGLFFGFILVRIFTPGDMYEDYYLYLLDVNYHFGNAYVFVHDVFGVQFDPATQASLATLTGVYDATGAGVDPLVGGMSSSVPLAGHVTPAVSTLVLFGLAMGLLFLGVLRFERADIS